jgi:tetratricopeptide (TPR) repeat protein
MTSPTHPVRRQLVCVTILLGAIGAVFGQTANFEFLNWDDNTHVVNNRYLHPVTLPNVLHFWQKDYDRLYIPLSYTWFSLEARLAEIPPKEDGDPQLDPRVFHLGNLALHAICVLLVFRLLRRFAQSDVAACMGALLFALHPVQVESVAWVSESRGLLAAVFSLLAIWNYVRFVDRSQEQTQDKAAIYWSRLHYGFALFAFLLALLSKPSAVAVPLMIAVIDRWMLSRTWKQALVALIPWLILVAMSIDSAKKYQANAMLDFVPPLLERPLIAGDALAFYFEKILFPMNLSFDYGLTPQRAAQDGWYYFAWMIPVGLGLALNWLPHRGRSLTCYGLFIAALFPVLGFVPFIFQNISTVADRYLYLAMLGPALALSLILARYPKKGLFAAAMAWLVLLGACSFKQAQVWHDSKSLNEHGLKINPHSWSAHNNLAGLLTQSGDYDEARMHYQQALQVKPNYWLAWVNLGRTLFMQKEIPAAIAMYRHVLAEVPKHYEANLNLAVALAELGAQKQAALQQAGKLAEAQQARDESIAEASKHFRTALRARSDDPYPYLDFGNALFEAGRVEQAVEQYEEALAIDPTFAKAYHNLGNALIVLQRSNEAVTQFALAIAYKPNYADAHNDLAGLLLQTGNAADAVTHYSIALRIRPDFALARFGLASALHQQGKTVEAVEQYRKALPLFPPDSAVAREIQDILRDAANQ